MLVNKPSFVDLETVSTLPPFIQGIQACKEDGGMKDKEGCFPIHRHIHPFFPSVGNKDFLCVVSYLCTFLRDSFTLRSFAQSSTDTH